MPASRKLVQQYSGPKDLLDRLSRDLQRLQQAPNPAAALDAATIFACTAWSLTAWLYASIYRDPQARQQLARLLSCCWLERSVQVAPAPSRRRNACT